MEYRIGDFSLVTRIPAKTLRYYHEVGLLEPRRIDAQSGYRLYSPDQLPTARLIRLLRTLEFPVPKVRTVVNRIGSGEDVTTLFANHEESIRGRIAELLAMEQRIAELGAKASGTGESTATAEALLGADPELAGPRAGVVSRRRLEPELCAAVRFTGAYREVGDHFGSLMARAGDLAAGIPMALYWQDEYHEDDADISVAVPVARPFDREGIEMVLLPATDAITSVYQGPYEGIGVGYERVFGELAGSSGAIELPIRERYIKGPGMEVSPDPEEYLTEIIVPVAEEAPTAAPRSPGPSGSPSA